MSCLRDVVRLYDIIAELQERLGGAQSLRDCDGRMRWPARGVYFFFEQGEHRSTSGSGHRIVRVGTHALTATSNTTLWDRLSQHRGSARPGGGNHRGSIFRLLVGEAMIRRDGLQRGSWGTGSSARAAAAAHALSTAAVRERERPVELVVSQLIGVMPFVWIRTDDAPGPASIRGVIERNAIALLSNFRKESIDPPSPAWLGLHSARERVRRSGLWNNNHVDEVYEPSFLEVLARAARETDRC